MELDITKDITDTIINATIATELGSERNDMKIDKRAFNVMCTELAERGWWGFKIELGCDREDYIATRRHLRKALRVYLENAPQIYYKREE